MKSNSSTSIEQQATRHYIFVVAFAVAMFGILFAIGLNRDGDAPIEYIPEQVVVEDIEDAYTLPKSEPVHVRIPAVGIDASFGDPLGINADRTVEVPESFEEVGYYKYGPTPGELGPAVVLGHVDSYMGAAVFWPLRNLEPGDLIYIDRADGTTATFTVTSLETHEQSGFPTEKVYSDLNHAGLRVITCSGVYSHSSLRYSHNLIVFAELTEDAHSMQNERNDFSN